MHRLSHWTPELEAFIHSQAMSVGFHLCGVATAVPSGESADSDGQRFAAWVEGGRAGEMEYLKRRDAAGAYLRSTLQTAMPWAQSILVCGFNYNAAAPRSIDPAPSSTGWIGRYAWSGRSAEQEARSGSGGGKRRSRADPHGLSQRAAGAVAGARSQPARARGLRDPLLRRHRADP